MEAIIDLIVEVVLNEARYLLSPNSKDQHQPVAALRLSGLRLKYSLTPTLSIISKQFHNSTQNLEAQPQIQIRIPLANPQQTSRI